MSLFAPPPSVSSPFSTAKAWSTPSKPSPLSSRYKETPLPPSAPRPIASSSSNTRNTQVPTHPPYAPSNRPIKPLSVLSPTHPTFNSNTTHPPTHPLTHLTEFLPARVLDGVCLCYTFQLRALNSAELITPTAILPLDSSLGNPPTHPPTHPINPANHLLLSSHQPTHSLQWEEEEEDNPSLGPCTPPAFGRIASTATPSSATSSLSLRRKQPAMCMPR